MSELTIASRRTNNGLRLVVQGEIDVQTAPELEAALAEAPSGDVLIDAGELHFIDSTGLRLLLDAARGHSAPRITLMNLQPQVRRVFSVAGVEHEFRFQES